MDYYRVGRPVYICRIVSSIRTISSNMKAKPNHGIHNGTVELDSHADTIVLGANCCVLSYTGKECQVSPYSKDYDAITNVPVVTGATVWTRQGDGQEFVVVFNEALWMGDRLDHTLLNQNQARHYGVTVQDNPYNKRPLQIETEDVVIPLQTAGTVIYFESRTPSQQELEELPRLILSSPHDWDPRTVQFPITRVAEPHYSIQTIASSDVLDTTMYHPSNIARRIVSAVEVDEVDGRFLPRLDIPSERTFQSTDRHGDVTATMLSERWHIGIAKAKNTMKATTQRVVRSAILPLARRYRADRMFERPRVRGIVYTDTMDGRYQTLDGNRHAQIFATSYNFVVAYPMERKTDAGEALKRFIADFGVPDTIISDGSQEQTGKRTVFQDQVRKHHIDHQQAEPYRHNQSKVEGVIREARKRWFRIMHRRRVPRRLWDYGLRWVCEIMQRNSSSAGSLNDRTSLEAVTGETPDISEYLDFSFYDPCWYNDNAGLGETKLGRWLGVSHRIGSLMSYWLLTTQGTVISRTTVSRVTNLELETTDIKERLARFDTNIQQQLNDAAHFLPHGGKTRPNDWDLDPLEHDADFAAEFHDVVSNDEVKEADTNFTPEVYDDTYINMELALPRGDDAHPALAKVTKRLRDANGIPIGVAHDNPILDTRMYEVEYPDGTKVALAANYIAENLFAQVDDDGNRQVLMDEIIGHRTNGKEVKQQDAFVTTNTGTKRRRQTTIGWELLVQWKDGSTNWIALKDIKESYPVQVAEYAVGSRIAMEPAFAWWVPHVLKKRNRILAKVKSKYWLRTHKFGIRVPKTVAEAIALDKENGNTLWWDAICKEMKNVRPGFEAWEKPASELPPGYQQIKCHIVFDIKMGENFRRKARFVAGGHLTETPSSLTYSSVVSRDSVRIALLIAALNGLKISACDIQNAYLTANCREKIWFVAGPELGSEEGTIMIIKKALYGLKSSGAAFRAHLAETLHDIGFKPSKADPDVWLRPAVKSDGEEYYEYVLCYVDDLLAMSQKSDEILKSVQHVFKLKDDKIKPPDMYLGAQLGTMEFDGVEGWYISSEKYVRAALENIEKSLAEKNQRLPLKVKTPLQYKYRPEEDTSPELKADGLQRYQELIGILRWAVELGRVDILLETAMMSTFLAMPRQGHLEQLYHICAYLKANPKRRLWMDPTYPRISEKSFQSFDWHDFYRDARESIPGDMPQPRGKSVSTHCFVDADHASDRVTRRSQTGILIFVNRAPIMWYSKRQNTVETSTFGSEFIAMKTAVEQIEGLRYKLRMFGVPLEGPTDVFCDNDAVFKNSSIPDSTLRKKHTSISYHRAREAVASGTIRVAKEGTHTNLADLFTKPLPDKRRDYLLMRFTY